MKTKKEKIIPKPDNYNFPDPGADDEDKGFGCDAVTCLHKAAEYEKWAERARECGRDDLIILYETEAKQWFEWYKDTEQG